MKEIAFTKNWNHKGKESRNYKMNWSLITIINVRDLLLESEKTESTCRSNLHKKRSHSCTSLPFSLLPKK